MVAAIKNHPTDAYASVSTEASHFAFITYQAIYLEISKFMAWIFN